MQAQIICILKNCWPFFGCFSWFSSDFGPGVEKFKQFFGQTLNDFSTEKLWFLSDFGQGVEKSYQFFWRIVDDFSTDKSWFLGDFGPVGPGNRYRTKLGPGPERPETVKTDRTDRRELCLLLFFLFLVLTRLTQYRKAANRTGTGCWGQFTRIIHCELVRTGTGPFFFEPETSWTGTGFIFEHFFDFGPRWGVLKPNLIGPVLALSLIHISEPTRPY